MRAAQAIVATCCVLGLLQGCVDPDLAVLEPRVSRVIDEPVGNGGLADVDLLLVIDNSGSMAEEQRILAREIPLLVRGLTTPPDENGDGLADWNAAESVRVAVITTDLGTNGLSIDSLGGCGLNGAANHSWGEDGALRADPSCDPAAQPVQVWTTGQDVDAFVNRVDCLARAGTGGCGFEQPLASAARALSRYTETGFPREDAILAVLVLTDEEDCSVSDAPTFYGTLPGPTEINRHCADNVHLLESVELLVEELSMGRDLDADTFFFAALAGLPVDLVDASPEEALADPRMQYVHDSGTATGLRTACEAYEGGVIRSSASPGRRFLEMAQRIPGALVRSICEDSFQPAIIELTRRIGEKIKGVCLGRALTPDAEGRVECRVSEVLPAGTSCEDLPGRVPLGADDRGRAQCEIDQAPGDVGSGWYYDLADATCDRVSFTEDAIPPIGTRLRFSCLVEVEVPDPAPTTGP